MSRLGRFHLLLPSPSLPFPALPFPDLPFPDLPFTDLPSRLEHATVVVTCFLVPLFLPCPTAQVNEETGEVAITEPKKIRGIGLVDFPADQLKAVIQAGVPVTCVQVRGWRLKVGGRWRLGASPNRVGCEVGWLGAGMAGWLGEWGFGCPPFIAG